MAKVIPPTFAVILFLLLPRSLTPESPHLFVVWNVGQGQWVTDLDWARCTHFDMGGERAPLKLINRLCRLQNNFLWLSHGDWDHLSFIQKSSLPTLCLVSPLPLVKSYRKLRLLRLLRFCNDADYLIEDSWRPPSQIKSANESSLVIRAGRVLIPGDSTVSQEWKWAEKMNLKMIRVLVLGHHGSRTSTGKYLLDRLPRLEQAISSSRKRRYGHPHPDVLARLSGKRVPTISTDDWGNIALEPGR